MSDIQAKPNLDGSLALNTPAGAVPADVDSLPAEAEARDPVSEVQPPAEKQRSTTEYALRWVGAVAMIYLLICGVRVISRGFRAVGGGTAENLFQFASNSLVGLSVGILATVLIQSSTVMTAITVAAVGSGILPVNVAIPIIIGSNLGTTVTCTIAAFGQAGDRETFRRSLAVSTIHDFFNLLAAAIVLPIEVFFHPLEKASGWLAGNVYGASLPNPSEVDFVAALTAPVVNLATFPLRLVGGTAGGVITIVIGAALLITSVFMLGTLLKSLLVGTAEKILLRVVGGHWAAAMATGLGMTVLIQSSTATTSILVPIAGTGVLTTRQIYPVTLGANIGTTLTALLAAFAVIGENAQLALQIAFVHVLYNLFSVAFIYGIPFLREIPPTCSEFLARVAVERKSAVIAYVVTVFIVLPALVILLSVLF